MSIEEQVQRQLEDAAEFIRQNIEDKGINASGRTSRAIKVQRIASGFVLGKFPEGERTAPLQTLEIGRPAGAVPMGFKGIIYSWTIEKGISTENDSHRWAIATNIAKKIAAEGTDRHHQHEDVFSTPVKMAAAEISRNIHAIFATEIKNIIQTNF